ncbi:MAG: CsgG/HfaB family protein [candidate division KSB1 bacterium]|nr:CsgG/HfaB family protein [candidate division KSB1 bacterium]MDZ7304705.1 CsgG/HfaB family protein [candidate division KSB1 bacterium]MDZ7312761.1 CsgG/HfaB family protein [candidate division KSB1 bacterium]
MNLRPVKPLFPLLLFIFFSFLSSFAQSNLGVLDFDNNSLADRQRLEPLRKGLAQMFSSELGQLQGLNLVERADLLRVIEEMKLAQAGMIDEKTAQQVGKLVGAQHLLLGSFVYLPNGKIRLDARIVEVETGRILKAGEATGIENQLFDLVKALNKKLVKELALRLSASELAKLDNLRNVKFSAVMLYSQAVACEDRGDRVCAQKKYREAIADDPNFAQAQLRLKHLEKMKP